MADIVKLRNYFQSLDKEGKVAYLTNLTPKQRVSFYRHPDCFLFDKQLIPGGDILPNGDWLFYLLRCGRSFGKTFAGAAWVANKIRQGAKTIGLCGATYDDVADVMVKAIIKWFLPDELEEVPYNHQRHQIRFTNGAVIHCYTSDKEIRGPNLEFLWCDEICAWADGIPEKIKERFEDITRAVRVGKRPQTLITSTPKTHPFFTDFQQRIAEGDKNYAMVQGSMLDNPTLTQQYIQEQISKYGNTSRGRQEVYGDLITDTPGAYWTHELIDGCRANLPSPLEAIHQRPQVLTNDHLMGRLPIIKLPEYPIKLQRVVIGFDPALSVGSDLCGIIVAALYSNKQAYVLEDRSEHYTPDQYAKLIDSLYRQYGAACVVVEKNNGGNSFDYILRTVNAHMKVVSVHTHQGKTTRAEHISALYHQGKVHHTQVFKELEDQQCSFNINYTKSPDRLDALGYALTELFWPSQGGQQISGINLPSR